MFSKKLKVKLPAVAGEQWQWQWRDFNVTYSKLGSGKPLIMFHGIGAAPWSYDFRNNVEFFAQNYTVYVPDLPGYGRSERKKTKYTAADYIAFQLDFVGYIQTLEATPALVISVSLSGAYTIAAATQQPHLFAGLVLIAPTGIETLATAPGKNAEKTFKILSGAWGKPLFWLINTRPLSRWFLNKQAYFSPNFITQEAIEAIYATTHQPNMQYAPSSFISFLLNQNVEQMWQQLTVPTLLVWGKQAKTSPYSEGEHFHALRPDIELIGIENARLSVYEEQAEQFNSQVQNWFTSISPIDESIDKLVAA